MLPCPSSPPRPGVVKRDASEMAAPHVGDAVVAREPFVDEGVVGREQLGDASVLSQDELEEELRLAPEPLAQALAESGEEVFVGLHRRGVAQAQPLAGEIGDERRRPRVPQHPLRLRLEHGRVLEVAVDGHVEQLVVRDAAPQEEREPGR